MLKAFISVIMPVYNRAEFIGEAIQSILSQTYTKFELIIVDDASTDETLKVVSDYNDERIILLKNKINKGVSACRNKGIELAKGDFIAFMDSDDISLRERFEKQIKMFFKYDDLITCGGAIKLLHSDRIIYFPETHNSILAKLLISSPFANPTVMIKRSIFKLEKFETNLRFGEDYDFFSRICWLGKMYNIPEPLLLYRVHENQLSGGHKQKQREMDAEISLSLFKKLDYSVSKFPDQLIKKILLFDQYFSLKEFSLFLKFLKYIKKENRVERIFPPNEFDKVIEEIRKNLLFGIYFKKNSIGLTKAWRIKSIIALRKKEALRVIAKKIKIAKS